MGMFDYIDNITVYCPKCGSIIANDFQTKDFVGPFLNHYSPGDEIPTDRDDEDYIEIHSICEECELFTGVYLKVVGNTLTNEII